MELRIKHSAIAWSIISGMTVLNITYFLFLSLDPGVRWVLVLGSLCLACFAVLTHPVFLLARANAKVLISARQVILVIANRRLVSENFLVKFSNQWLVLFELCDQDASDRYLLLFRDSLRSGQFQAVMDFANIHRLRNP